MKTTQLNYFILTFLCLALYLPGLTALPTVDRDEAHFAQATKQMLETGNFFQIRFQDNTRFQKPPGINWLQALSVSVFSEPQANAIWPYRVPSTLGALITVLLTFAFVNQIYGSKIALIASSLLASSLLLTVQAHMALTDAMLLAATIVMQGSLWLIYSRFHKTGGVNYYLLPLAFWLAMSFGFALKGVTPFIALLTIVTLSLVDRNLKWLKSLRPIYGISLFLLTSLWLILVNSAEETNYFMAMLEKDLLPKLISGHESHGGPPGYHLALSFLTFWPSSAFLWLAVVWGWQQRKNLNVKFLFAWIIPTWMFFEIMPTKLPQYVLPTFLALSILCALAIVNSNKLILTGKNLLLSRLFLLVWAGVSLTIATGLLLIPRLLMGKFLAASIIAFIVICLTLLTTLFFFYKQTLIKATYCIIIGAVISYAAVFQVALPQLSDVWLSEKIAFTVENALPNEISAANPLHVFGYSEPSLVFLIGTNNIQFDRIDSLSIDDIADAGTYLALVSKPLISQLDSLVDYDQVNIEKIQSIQGYNYNKGKRVELVLMSIKITGVNL